MRGALLDTHTLLWALGEPERLGAAARAALLEPGRGRWVSTATLWELAIKLSLGKLRLGLPLGRLVAETLPACGLSVLAVEATHAIAVRDLPLHHRDPFDRLLVAQARAEDLDLLSADATLDAYEIRRVW